PQPRLSPQYRDIGNSAGRALVRRIFSQFFYVLPLITICNPVCATGPRIIWTLPLGSKYQSCTGKRLKSFCLNNLGGPIALIYMGENSVQFIQTVVIDNQFTFAFCRMLNLDTCTQALGKLFL